MCEIYLVTSIQNSGGDDFSDPPAKRSAIQYTQNGSPCTNMNKCMCTLTLSKTPANDDSGIVKGNWWTITTFGSSKCMVISVSVWGRATVRTIT